MAAKTEFKLPYVGIAADADLDILYGAEGDFSAVIAITNPVVQYGASPEAYDDYHNILINVVKLLGDGYILQKLDVFSKAVYPYQPAAEFLQQKYNEHFAGRIYVKIETFLVITRQVKRGAFYVYNARALRDFRQSISKIIDIFQAAGMRPGMLDEKQINKLIMQTLSMNFSSEAITLDNILPLETELQLGDRAIRSICLINIDSIDLPSEVGSHMEWNEKDTLKGFPVDFLSFLLKVPGCDCIVYNQVIEIPGQTATLRKLELKKKRHSGIPDPANTTCVEDIDQLLTDVARENQLLVNCHFNIIIAAPKTEIQKASNFIESSLFGLGIIANKNSYNQLELFRTALPGNAVELKKYDWFLTTCDAALCFVFKESLPKDEQSDFLIRFTDRQGIPVSIDPADLPMRNGRINNRNKFILGPSGSGKSFFMNALVEQYMLYNMDVVIVDVGHSYSGLCTYYKGKYITYSDDKPITMNPFQVTEEEYNIEKKDFLVTLIALLWKGADGSFSTVERDVIAQVISAYYHCYFNGNGVSDLSFNTFYDFALQKVPEIKQAEKIPFDLEEFRFVLKKFYRGGDYGSILNEAADESLFGERFIVYEIDNLQGNKILFPIVTLIIMDVFIQKMRHRKQQRKALILEEAWRALTSPVMAGFLLYLVKTVRKFWGELIPVTQELNDMLGNPTLKDSLISNTDTVILLDQTKFKDNYKEISALLSITETERKKIFTINQLENKENRGRFKEVYIRRGAVGEVYGVEVALAQYLTFSTEKPEKSAVEIYTRRYGSYPQGLDAFIKNLQTSGKSLGEFVRIINEAGEPLTN
ncbi:TraG family conjugative transposon ATPase [Mucilaginibacter sp. X5P1]|uniref:TraG family conjugative transposon ATPase n=1 Tax=Mucilaginibacter sp. X5P1 TaxID=2723088 RepID=UPI00160E3E1E|nr:TraG family conjugative transposon ATPase [Mucilaginibacter sp. X5P1]MBB6137668.1 conjugation system TraG family ATPase [Mucilaginibacter sp. X5P1]